MVVNRKDVEPRRRKERKDNRLLLIIICSSIFEICSLFIACSPLQSPFVKYWYIIVIIRRIITSLRSCVSYAVKSMDCEPQRLKERKEIGVLPVGPRRHINVPANYSRWDPAAPGPARIFLVCISMLPAELNCPLAGGLFACGHAHIIRSCRRQWNNLNFSLDWAVRTRGRIGIAFACGPDFCFYCLYRCWESGCI